LLLFKKNLKVSVSSLA